MHSSIPIVAILSSRDGKVTLSVFIITEVSCEDVSDGSTEVESRKEENEGVLSDSDVGK